MSSPDPIKLLENSLAEHQHNLEKSKELYANGKIDAETHVIQKENLTRLIADYTYAVYLLKKHQHK